MIQQSCSHLHWRRYEVLKRVSVFSLSYSDMEMKLSTQIQVETIDFISSIQTWVHTHLRPSAGVLPAYQPPSSSPHPHDNWVMDTRPGICLPDSILFPKPHTDQPKLLCPSAPNDLCPCHSLETHNLSSAHFLWDLLWASPSQAYSYSE